MPSLVIQEVVDDIMQFCQYFGITYRFQSVHIEKEWADFRLEINDTKQMERINVWLQNDLKSTIRNWYDIEVSAPVPVVGSENVLRIRLYDKS